MDVKTAIRDGDADTLRRLLIEDSSRANALLRWGENDCVVTHPLHYVSDMLFEGALQKGKELPLVEALIQAGADLDFQRNREDGKKSDTPLIGAADQPFRQPIFPQHRRPVKSGLAKEPA